MPTLRSFSTVLCLLLIPFLFACTRSRDVTQTQTYLQDIEDYRVAELDTASSLLKKKYRAQEEDEVLYQLELGMLHHYRMKWDESAQHFQHASRAIEKHYTKDITKNLKSLLVNDLQLPYAGEPYENIYLSTFNCLNYLHKGDIRGGLVEVRKINHKLSLLNDRYKGLASSLMHNKGEDEDKEKFNMARKAVEKVDKKLDDINLLSRDSDQPVEIQQNSALGHFMSTVLYAKTGEKSDARISLEKLRTSLEDQGNTEFLAHFPDQRSPQASTSSSGPSASSSSMTASSDSSSGSATSASTTTASSDSSSVTIPSESDLKSQTAYNMLLLSFTGAPPRKEDKSFEFNFTIDNEEVQLNFAVPTLETPGTVVERVHAIVAGDTLRVPLVENMQTVAKRMFQQKLPIIYTRAIMRSFIKAAGTEAAEQVAENEMGAVAGWLTEQAGEAVSKSVAEADTRAWQTMPGFAHATVAQVPAGKHDVTFEYLPSKNAPETSIHVMKEDSRWVVTTAGLDLVDEIDDVTAIDSYGDIAQIAAEDVGEHDLFRAYKKRKDAIAAGRRLARNHVPSTLIVYKKNGTVKKTKSFETYKRRVRQVTVRGKDGLGVAESIYSN